MNTLNGGEFILMDGAMGTELERRGVPIEGHGWSAFAVASQQDVVREIHQDYLEIGARIHITNSFALGKHVLEPVGLGHEFENLNRRSVELFEEAVSAQNIERKDCWLAGSLSTFAANSDRAALPEIDELTENYVSQAEILHGAGVDLFALEMLFDTEVTGSMLRAIAHTGLPAILGFTCDWSQSEPDRLVTQHASDLPELPLEDVLSSVLENVDPEKTIPAIMHSDFDVSDAALEVLNRYWTGPVAIYPNSGTFIDLHLQFDTVRDVASFQRAARAWINAGVQIVGGCCGIGPSHLRGLRST